MEDATELALDRPLWRLLAASGATQLKWCKLNHDDDGDDVCICYIQNTVDRTIQLKLADKQRISQRPRRSCGLQPAPVDAEVIGKVRQ